MARSEELPIYRDTVDMLDRLLQLTDKVPRTYRFGVWQRMLDLAIDMLSLIYAANSRRDQVPVITELIDRLGLLKVLLRLSLRRHVVNDRQYASIIIYTERIGRQATGWRQHYEKQQ